MVSSSKGAGLSQTGQVHVGFFSFICRKKTASKHWRWAQVRTRHGTPSRIFTSWKTEWETQEVNFKQAGQHRCSFFPPLHAGYTREYSLDRWGRLGGPLSQFRSLDQIVVCLGLQATHTHIMIMWYLRSITQRCCCLERSGHLLRSRQRSALSTEHSLSWLKRSDAVKTLTK